MSQHGNPCVLPPLNNPSSSIPPPLSPSSCPHRYQQAELVHCRFAMLGVAGVLVPDLFRGIGLGGPAAQVKWFDAGAYEYFAPAKALFLVQMFLFAWVELRRWVGWTGGLGWGAGCRGVASCRTGSGRL